MVIFLFPYILFFKCQWSISSSRLCYNFLIAFRMAEHYEYLTLLVISSEETVCFNLIDNVGRKELLFNSYQVFLYCVSEFCPLT